MKRIFTFFPVLFGLLVSHSIKAEPVKIVVNKSEIQAGYYVHKLWLEHYGIPEVEISSAVYENLDQLPADFQSGSAAQFDMIPGMELKRPFIFLRIPAYSIHPETKHPQLLVSFELTIKEKEVPDDIAAQQKTTASSSVLATGHWHKIAVSARGIYKVDYDFVKNKLGITGTVASANIRLFGNGGTMLSESNAIERDDDLVENAIQVIDGGDGTFGQGDYFLFYANGPMAWIKDSMNQRFYHRKNLYEDKSYYFISTDQGAGLRIANQQDNLTENITVTDFNDYMAHEEDLVNVGKFGKEWWGEEFSTEPGKQNIHNFNFVTGQLLDSAFIRLYFGSRSLNSGNVFSISLNGQSLGNYSLAATNYSDEQSDPIVTQYSEIKFPAQNTADFQFYFTPAISTGRGYLNYIELNTRRALSFPGGQLNFRDWKSVGAGKVAKYSLQNANSNLQVWDITDPLLPVRMNGSLTGGSFSFKQDAARLHEFISFDGSYLSPEYTGPVANQDLHGHGQVDYIIVSHPDFLDAAYKLADFHRAKENMRVVVVTPQQVYNEFSSGSQDISAIRDFARMFYKRAGTDSMEMPKYLLLLGDASYDYKKRLGVNTNYVPSYQTAESMDVILGFCTDDFFSFLDDNENIEQSGIANTMDIGVGRIPAKSADEAMGVVNKVIHYGSPASLGPWRISTTIMSDNRDNAGDHLNDGEYMAAVINSFSSLYNETKVYLDALPMVSTPGGTRCPEANKIINDQVFKGTFLMNYSGHGGISTLTSERIVTQDDYNNWNNINKMPIMVTATCEFARFDNPEYVSSGEKLILKSNGGAIALLTTTQLVYQYLNRPMNAQFLSSQFRKYNGKWPAFGDAFRYGKNITYVKPGDLHSLANYRKFALLGDPALTPAFPKHNIVTESIIDGNTLQSTDTFKALGKYIVKGNVQDENGQVLTDFNGRIYVTIFDKPRTISTLTAPYVTYNIQNNVIYKGKATVTNGKFSVTFITPKDLNYDFGLGKISYYAENGDIDAAGADTTVITGGFSDNPIIENDPPVVKPFMNDSLFINGGITGANTLLYAQLFDETGINVSGNSIGHDLTAILDNDMQHPYILNDYYETAPNDYKRGYVYFPITGLSDGKHSFRLKAWDMNNNSGEGIVNFEVVNGKIVKLQNLLNYPNPFSDYTHFVFDHNHPHELLEANILIYNSEGALVRTISEKFIPEGSRSHELTWDGTSDFGAKLPTGLYIYRLNISTEKGIQSSAYEKLILVR